VIVNDMASVNIDAKLVKSGKDGDNTSSSSNNDGSIIELQNGCACCSLADELLTTVETMLDVRRRGGANSNNDDDNAFDAVVVELSGVADPIAIQQNWKAANAAGHPVTKKAEMKRVVTLIDSSTFGTDWMTWDVAGERDGWVDPDDQCAQARKVPELLAEQVEAADVLLLNKIDLAGPEQVEVATALARSINDKAVLERVEYGKIASPKQIVREEKIETAPEADGEAKSGGCCSNPKCPSNATPSPEAECSSTTSSTPTSLTEPRSTVSTDDLGIVNFVYKADRPFESLKLMSLLNTWPVPIKEDLGGLEHFAPKNNNGEVEEDIGRESPFFGVLRSKGFCWMAPTKWGKAEGDPWRHDTAMYWSHAGKHFGISVAGKWWATLEAKQMKEFFENGGDQKEYERIQSEDFVSEKWGDRRQELVFIGVNIDQEKITNALDDCLLGDRGMERYSEQVDIYKKSMKN